MTSMAVVDAINDEVLARFDRERTGYVPEDQIAEAYPFAKSLQLAADQIEAAVETIRGNRFRTRIMVAALQQLHPVELDEIALRIAQTVALKDPSRVDARYGERLQAMADLFRHGR